jgi:DNA-binding transcriptional MerR regulator
MEFFDWIGLMKISELAKKADIPKQTVHYYIRAGLLPKPRKLGSNSAEYDESYVERIKLIKDLQKDFFFPLPTIKKIMWEHRSAAKQAQLKLRSEYFRPLEQYLGSGVVGDEAFVEATGLNPKYVPRFKNWGYISDKVADDENVYSQDDVIIGKVLVHMHKLGLNRKNNFPPEQLQTIAFKFLEIVKKQMGFFLEATKDWKQSEREELAMLGNEVMGVFFYHLYRKMATELREELLDNQETDDSGTAE